MRARTLILALVASTLLAAIMHPPAEAQRGLGRGRGRQSEPAPKEQQTPKEELAPGEYSFDGLQVLEAINRGEGRQALAYYERTASEAEKQGNQLRAARALVACSGIVPVALAVLAATRRPSSRVAGRSSSTRAPRSRRNPI